jgi:hypothetical protein
MANATGSEARRTCDVVMANATGSEARRTRDVVMANSTGLEARRTREVVVWRFAAQLVCAETRALWWSMRRRRARDVQVR